MVHSWWRRWWLIDVSAIVRAGRFRPLGFADAPPLTPPLEPRSAHTAFDALSLERFFAFIARAFFLTGAPARLLIALTLGRQVTALSLPLLLHAVLTHLPNAASQPCPLFAAAIGFGVMGMLSGLITQHWFQQALAARAIVVSAINRRVVSHALRLQRSARAGMETGDLVNHLGSDTDALAESGFFLPETVNTALSIMIASAALVLYIGWAALAALATLAVLSPLTLAIAMRYRKLDDRMMSLRDQRATRMSQILHGIRVVKYHAWEASSAAEVQALRQREVSTRLKLVAADLASSMIWVSTSTLIAFAGLGSYVALGGELDAPTVFACLVLFQMLEEPFGFIPHILARGQHARVAAARLASYFRAHEREHDERALSPADAALGVRANQISVQHAGAPRAALECTTLEIAPGSSVAIVGPVGAGKSTLARVLAGVEPPSTGLVDYTCPSSERPRVGYVPQEAFILNASVRENIAFGELQASAAELTGIALDCALAPDLASMPAGLETEIGERGVNLSGGQKQRVALARAAYHRPGLVVLDDPLSAVDVNTERTLVSQLLFSRMREITRVVVTHRLDHLARFDRVLFLVDGRIEAQGSYPTLMRENAAFRSFTASTGHSDHHTLQALDTPATTHTAPHAAGSARVTEDEDRETGAVRFPVYRDYARALVGSSRIMAPIWLALLVLSAIGVAILPILQRVWFARFTAGKVAASPWHAVVVYAALGALVMCVALAQRALWMVRATMAGRSLHDGALRGVLSAPLRFFDATPIGRILNRFTHDTESVEDELVWALEQCFRSLCVTTASLALIIALVPWVLLVTPPVFFLYYVVQRDYRRVGREAKRLESIARSPRYAQFKELVSGLDVIHGFARERVFMDSFYAILSRYQRVFWCSVRLNRWFGVRMALVGGLIALGTSVSVALLAYAGAISTSIAGLVLMYTTGLWGALNWTVRALSDVEARMTSTERLQHYARLPAEPNTHGNPLPESEPWPVRGEITFREVVLRYASHLPRVLDGVSLHVPASHKVGIIGRTGAGKSTLIQALFRFVEPESGAIFIDGVDIARIPLARLRQAIAVIPQDPTLFAGTLRANLDRFGAYDDDALWTSLRRVHLDDVVRALPGQLDAPVSEHGHNFSQGQRQLICTARAILARARIVMLDEATASVDRRTDERIQRTIRQELQGVTVLVIAHRLDTIADCDQIIELAAGKVIHTRSTRSSEPGYRTSSPN